MQQQAGLQEFLAHIAKNTLFLSSFPLPQPLPPNEKLAITWHFDFWLPKNTPIPSQKTKSWPETGHF